MMDFFFNCWCLETRPIRITAFGMCQGAPTIMRITADCKSPRISMSEVVSVPHGCTPEVQIGLSVALYMRIFLLVESFDFRPSSQCILVSVISSFFRTVNMCLRQISLMSRCNPRYLTPYC
jgi:hypothetical protein